MTLLGVGLVAVALGGGLLLFCRPLASWNGRTADAWRSEHVRGRTPPSDGHPAYIRGVGAAILLLGVVLSILGLVR